MEQTVKVQYPDPTNFEKAVLVIDICQLGDYITSGDSQIVRIPVTYKTAKAMSAQLGQMDGLNTFVHLNHSKGKLTVDATLAAEIFAALVEIIVEVEIGEDLAMFEVEELECVMS